MNKNTEVSNKRRQRLRDEGLCVLCGKESPQEGYTVGLNCREKLRLKRRAFQEAGKCQCGSPNDLAHLGNKCCSACRKRASDWRKMMKERRSVGTPG